jgi:CubicO group peptidase (beta-lactamase class C family)
VLDFLIKLLRHPRLGIATALLFANGVSLAASSVPTDSDLTAWADQTLTRAITDHRSSGIAVSIVRDGKTLFSKGYGFSDVDRQVAVDPGQTPFSIGSITKCFTATAIAQLLERGVIHSLDDPANAYLRRIKLPRFEGHEVSVRHLITHRGGIDESIYGLATAVPVAVPISASAIRERLPPVVRTPGEVSVYSNIGYGVLGVLIEDVTGLTYGEYLRKNVFAPLDMSHSFVRYDSAQPIAIPVEFGPGDEANPIPQQWSYHPFISSSASVVSTADDMAKFALAHMNAEQGSVPELMNAATAHLMHDRSTANAPHVAGFGMSFIANTWNGTRVTENAGSGPGFQALFILMPDLQTGFIALIMGGGEESLRMFALRQQFLNFYLHPLEPLMGPSAGFPMNRYAGIYQSERRPHSSSEAVYAAGTTLDVKAEGTDKLTINGEQGYREIAPATFWKPGVVPYVPDDASSDMYVFVQDTNGKVKFVAPYLSVDVYKPVRILPTTFRWLTLSLCTLCGTGLLAAFWPRVSNAGRFLKPLAIGIGMLAIAIPAILAWSLQQFGSYITMIGFGNVWPLQLASGLATLLLVMFILFAISGLRARHELSSERVAAHTWAGLHAATLAITGILLVLALSHYNLIGNHVP